MNKIIVEVSICELFDKISILEIKKEKVKDQEKLKYITDEHSILKSQLDNNIKNKDKVYTFNGWTFASSPTLNPFDHPIYDIWLKKCFN